MGDIEDPTYCLVFKECMSLFSGTKMINHIKSLPNAPFFRWKYVSILYGYKYVIKREEPEESKDKIMHDAYITASNFN